ncbi:TIGR03943 family putative permease subunit [Terrisporobacter sp.]
MVKKFLGIILITICLLSLLVGCSKNEIGEVKKSEASNETIKVMESVYVDYINDIYLDSEKYLGKTIEIEGMFTKETDEKNKNHMYVYRIAQIVKDKPYDTYDDSHSHEETEISEEKYGLQFSYNKNIPKENEWIKVIGKLTQKDGNLIIQAKSVDILKNRGIEKVTSFY